MFRGLLNSPIGGLIVLVLLVGLAFYIYGALALMSIAKRTRTKNAWLAWIPIVNIYLMMRIGRLPAWTLALWLLVFVPVVSGLASVGMSIWYWWAIAEQRKRPGWWGILMIVPILNLVLMGIMAWGKDPRGTAMPLAPRRIMPARRKKVAKRKAPKRKVAKRKAPKRKVTKRKAPKRKKAAKRKVTKRKATRRRKR